jgi:hypothetical protein
MFVKPAHDTPLEFRRMHGCCSRMLCSFDDPKLRVRSAGTEQFERKAHWDICIRGPADEQRRGLLTPAQCQRFALISATGMQSEDWSVAGFDFNAPRQEPMRGGLPIPESGRA